MKINKEIRTSVTFVAIFALIIFFRGLNDPSKKTEIQNSRASLNIQAISSCSAHEGVDCRRGSDSDGSVICKDGYTESIQMYIAECKRDVKPLSVVSVSHNLGGGKFAVMLRNNTNEQKKNVSVFYKKANGDKVQLKGPDKLDSKKPSVYKFQDKDLKNSKRLRFSDFEIVNNS